jgi:hypothetical protein
VTTGVGVNTYYARVYEGLGVFRGQRSEPEDLDDLWLKMREPDLARSHQERIAPVDAARARTLAFSLGGLAGLLGGAGIYAATKDSATTGADVALGVGLVLGLVGVVGTLASQPSAHDQLEANARRKLFIGGEDDEEEVLRGVGNANEERRRQCAATPNGTPEPSSPPPHDW